MVDPHADSDSLKKEYGFGLVTKMANDYDAVVIAVNHESYSNFDEAYFKSITSENPVIVDIKGIYRNKINNLTYWSL